MWAYKQNMGLLKDIENVVRRKKRPTINIFCFYYHTYSNSFSKLLIY